MMEYPALMYRCPGAYGRPGGTYSNMGVNSEDEAIAAIEAGWYETLPEAIEAHDKTPSPAMAALLEVTERDLNELRGDMPPDKTLRLPKKK